MKEVVADAQAGVDEISGYITDREARIEKIVAKCAPTPANFA